MKLRKFGYKIQFFLKTCNHKKITFLRQKEAEFDVDGRPFQSFFYTLKPNLNQKQFELRDCIEAVTIFGDRLIKQGKRADSNQVNYRVLLCTAFRGY